MKKKILFFDTVAPYEYNFDIINKSGLGASESYLLSLANELKKNFDVDIAGVKTNSNYIQNDIRFRHTSKLEDNYDTIIIQRKPEYLRALKFKYPNAKFIIWLHDLYERSPWPYIPNDELQYIVDNSQIICVSDWQKQEYLSNFESKRIKNINIDFIHFFIDDENDVSNSPIDYDKNKLSFFSGGHKGLRFTLQTFEYLLKINPKFKLYIGNPAHSDVHLVENEINKFPKVDAIVYLKNQTRNQVLSHLKESLATLHLNKEYPETFGCVNAESNMVGTPVCCYDLGATKEILYKPEEQIIESNPTTKVLRWYDGLRPKVKLNPIFDKSVIIKKWLSIL